MLIEPDKVYTYFRPPTTSTEPIMGRKYTITHSDDTAELFVTIAPYYADDMIDEELRDEVKLEWTMLGEHLVLLGEVLVSDEVLEARSEIRDQIFKREMPKALSGMRYGDRVFFENLPQLNQTPILIQFKSHLGKYHKLYHFGYVEDYK